MFMALLSFMAALTLVGLGAASASAATSATTACHETALTVPGHHGVADEDAPKPPAKAAKLMACCIACVAAAPVAPGTAQIRFARPALQPTPQRVRTGLTPAPEPEPPKA